MTLAARTRSELAVTDTDDGWHVQAHRTDSYRIHVGTGLITRLGEMFMATLGELHAPSVIVAADSGVMRHHLPAVTAALSQVGVPVTVIPIPAGEASKSVEGLLRLLRALRNAGATRRTLVVGLGGGMVCDLVTAAAAVYLRGVPYALVPTTVLAQLDAAIGGKGAINWEDTKNLLGAFHHPVAVIIDPTLTRTLPARQMRDGLAEAIKVALIADADLFADLETAAPTRLESAQLTRTMRAAVAAKLSLIAPDPFELGDLRRPLNLGHCLGHPLEAATGYRMPHGEAVAAGTAAAAALACRAGLSSTAERDRIVRLLAAYQLPTTMPARLRDTVWQGLGGIRRVRNGHLHLIVPVRPGHCVVHEGLDRPAFDAALDDLDQWKAPR